jgi:hypothetical protein
MKRNNELDKAYYSFINDIKLLIEESGYVDSEKSKKIDKRNIDLDKIILFPTDPNEAIPDKDGNVTVEFTKNPKPLFTEMDDLERTRQLAFNANFVYCFALFENYASKVVKITFKNGGGGISSPKRKYINKFKEFAKQRATLNDMSYVDMLTNSKKMLDNYSSLPRKTLLWTHMFGIDKEGMYKKYILRYDEARERRNLLIHRGVYADNTYKKSFLQIHSKADNGMYAKKFLDDTLARYAVETEESRKLKTVDISVLPDYLFDVFGMLFVMASLIYFYSFRLTKTDLKDGDSIFAASDLMHELMISSYEMDTFFGHMVINPLIEVLAEYKANIATESWKDIPTIDKCNYLICHKYMYDLESDLKHSIEKDKKLSDEEKNEMIDKVQQIITNRGEIIRLESELISATIPENRKKHFQLLESHLDDDVDNIIKIFPELGLDDDSLEDWFMFQKYKNNAKFKKFKKSYKKKMPLKE